MKRVTLATAVALGVSATMASAGGFDRSGQPIGWIFESGNYVELSFGSIRPSVKGVQTQTLSGTSLAGSSSGNMAKAYSQVGVAFKMDLNDKVSVGMQLDPTFGADVSYPASATGYFLRGTTATIDGDSLVVAGRYKLNDKISVHAGIKSVGVGGNVFIARDGVPAYQATFGFDRAAGYLVGIAYEKPEIALRAALTYSSATTHDLVTTVGGRAAGVTQVELPASVSFDFQSGIAKDTLLFGQIRWSDWTATELNGPLYPANPLIGYDEDTVSYSLGIGRRFNENWSAAVTLGYEAAKGGIASNFSPTDGSKSIGLGATYTKGNMKITGGVRYVALGDTPALTLASPPFPPGTAGANYTGNTAVGIGLKISFTF